MYNLIDYHIPEAIQIQVTKRDPNTESRVSSTNGDATNVCNFCVDPQITSYSVLQALLVRAFNLECDFFLYYLNWQTNKRCPLTNCADLLEAFRTASHPYLDICLDVIDYSRMSAINVKDDDHNEVESAEKSHLSKKLSKYTANILADWDVVTSSDVILAQTITKTNNFIFNQIQKLKTKAKSFGNVNNNSWYLAETIFQYIVASYEDRKEAEPLDDLTFRSYLDADGRVQSQRDLRIAIYRSGVDSSLRGVLWKHLLNIYPDGYTGQERIDFIKFRCETYRQMRDLWQRNRTTDPRVISLCNMVLKDARRTDRHHAFYASPGSKGSIDIDDFEHDNPNVKSLFNILITYGLNHQYLYCQGMSDLASPLLYVLKDEAQAYIAFCALMKRLGHNFSRDGKAVSRKFSHLVALLQHYDPELYQYLRTREAHDLVFCYRWILLDLKREFPFEDTLRMMEVLWASIPPTKSSSYLDLFDPEHLYIPNDSVENKVQLDNNSFEVVSKSPESENKTNKKCSKSKNATNKLVNKQVRNIKFLPNVLSVDSQVLDSPTSTSDESNNEFEDLSKDCRFDSVLAPKPWDSPVVSSCKNRKFAFEPPPGSSKFYLGSISGDYFSYDDDEHESTKEYEEVFNHAKNNKVTQEDDISTCSTFDSGIHRSNTITSMFQDDSTQSNNSIRTELSSGEFPNIGNIGGGKSKLSTANRRKRFHCLNGLRNAHCNGDDVSEDEETEGQTETFGTFDEEVETVNDSRFNDIDPGYLTEDCKKCLTSGGDDENGKTPKNVAQCSSTYRFKPLTPLAKAKNLLGLGRSVSVDSLTSCDTVTSTKEMAKDLCTDNSAISFTQKGATQNETKSIHESIVDKFNYLSAKSVSEEMLNEAIVQMETLSTGSNNSDNCSSSTSSSLVILPAPSDLSENLYTTKDDDESKECVETNSPLLSPDELGSNDAFMLFLCLTILLQNRDKIIDQQMDRNDIHMYFDSLIRKHNVNQVLKDARHLFHTYLSQWHKECLHN